MCYMSNFIYVKQYYMHAAQFLVLSRGLGLVSFQWVVNEDKYLSITNGMLTQVICIHRVIYIYIYIYIRICAYFYIEKLYMLLLLL